MTVTKDWFASWFDTSYYHTLYKHRDFSEGQVFMEHLTTFLKLTYDDIILDLACGKGRHSIFLNSMGYKVVGADLSANNIAHAKTRENQRLRFVEHDMRTPLNNTYNAIFNLFTRFGFFEDDKEDIAVMKHIKNGLKPGGVAVIDFMNVKKVIPALVPEEKMTVDGINFCIKRYVKDSFIVKEINVEDKNNTYQFFEKVKYLDLEKFKSFCLKSGLTIVNLLGSYDLKPFNEKTSDRLILVLQ